MLWSGYKEKIIQKIGREGTLVIDGHGSFKWELPVKTLFLMTARHVRALLLEEANENI